MAKKIKKDTVPETHWNYRILAFEHPITKEKDVYFQIHEVYYTDGVPDGYAEQPASISGECMKEILDVIERIKGDVTSPRLQPILWADDKWPQEYKPVK